MSDDEYIRGLMNARQVVRDQKMNASDHSKKRNEGFLQGVAWCESAIVTLIIDAIVGGG